MYKRIDADIYFDISTENIIFTADDIDLDKFFTLYDKTKMDNAIGMPLQTFTGLSSDCYSNFISNFNNLLLIKNITEDAQKQAVFHLSLADPARCWYNSLPEDKKDTWKNAQRAFKDKYGAGLSPVEVQIRSAEFSKLVWQQGQELEQFYATIVSTGRNMSENKDIVR